MPESVFNQPLKKLKEFQAGKPISARQLNEGVKDDNRKRGVSPARQKRPEGGGVSLVGGGVAVGLLGQEFRILDPEAIKHDQGHKDIILGRMYNADLPPEQGREHPMPWRVQLPWVLRRTPFEHIETIPPEPPNTSDFRGKRYHYNGHFKRVVTTSPHNITEGETQVIVPEFWGSPQNRPDSEIITASAIDIYADRVARTRKDVLVSAVTQLNGYQRITLAVSSGEGDTIPGRDVNAILNVRKEGASVLGQIAIWAQGSANPTVYVVDGAELEDLDRVTVRWSKRWQMWPDRTWAEEFA